MVTKLLRSRAVHSALGILISGSLILYIVAATDWSQVGGELGAINYWAFIPVIALFVLHYTFRAWRWKYLVPPAEGVTLRRSFDAIQVGNFATFILPLRAGEFVRSFLLSRTTGHSFSTCFVSVIVERFFDLAVVLLSFAIVAMNVQGLPAWVGQGALALTILAGCIFALMVVGTFLPAQTLSLTDYLLKYLPEKWRLPLRKFCAEFLEGAAVLRRGANLVKVIFLSLMVWLSCYVLFHAYFLLFNLSPSPWVSVTTAVVVALAVAAPSLPGFVGVYQAGCIAGFLVFGLTKELAVAYSIVSHVFQYIVFVAYGSFVLMQYDMKLSELRSRAKPPDEAA